MLIALLILCVSPTTSTTARLRAITKMDKYASFTFPSTRKISDDQLIIKDFSSFVRNHSLREGPQANKPALRMAPKYIPVFKVEVYNEKLFNLMKQSLYAAQDRLKHLQGILAKYQDDVGFRAGYVFTKLEQLQKDMQRIYSYAVKRDDYATVKHNIIFYRHMTKKNIDVTYIVEYLFTFHDKNVKNLRNYFAQIENAMVIPFGTFT